MAADQSSFSLMRRFTSLGGPSRQNFAESPEDLRGPLNLRVQYDPKDPYVEFIFVHGIPGGSRRTWSHNSHDPATFWPKEWLPLEPGFANVRIHTFGYEVDWLGRRADATRISLVGKTLLEKIASDNYIRNSDSNPIVFIAHSLGGLVVKQAYNEAKRDLKYEHLAHRFHSFFFLATPHQDFDNLTMIANILRAGGVDGKSCEVDPNFEIVAREINQSFRQYCNKERLYSFFETSANPLCSRIIVSQDAANLGFTGQGPIAMMADHIGISRFVDTTDSAYQLLRDKLAETARDISDEFLDPEKIQDQMRLIAEVLGVTDTEEEEELQSLELVPGSCEWMLEKEAFLQWRDSKEVQGNPEANGVHHVTRRLPKSPDRTQFPKTSRILWLLGLPGSGKTHISARVISYLKDKREACNYYFLKYSDRSKRSIDRLLKSLAYQMAAQDVTIRRTLLHMHQDRNWNIDTNDVRVLWKQLFIQKIFKAGSQTVHFWVIDALDESVAGPDLIKLFDKIPASTPLKIFISSRQVPHLVRDIKGLSVTTMHVEAEDTLEDIRLYVEENRDCIHIDGAPAEPLIERIILKSRGSFLWTRVILDRLDEVWTLRLIEQEIEKMPKDMNELYQRILNEMAPRDNKELPKAILRWLICASRILTTVELQAAVQKDIEDSVPMMDQMIGDVCGQLVVIEKQGKVRLIHDTAKDFLLNPDLRSEFAIDEEAAHGRVAEVCLGYLIEGDSRQGFRTNRTHTQNNPFALHEYAHLYFSEHVLRGPPADSELIESVINLLDTRILYTVEYIAQHHDLHCLIQIGKNLDAWIDRRLKHNPLDNRMKYVRGWATDLIRLVTVFGRNIVSNPSCVHIVIPPLCPPDSQVFIQYGSNSPGMEVVGFSKRTWNDRVFNARFQDDVICATACCETRYAVALHKGTVVLYDASTCQETRRFHTKAPITFLAFATLNEWILVSGHGSLSLWNYNSGEWLWSTPISPASEIMALSFGDNDSTIVTAMKDNQITYHNVSDGEVLSRDPWQSAEQQHRHVRVPVRITISYDLGVVAVIYKNQPVWLLNLSNLARPRYFGGHSSASAVAFNAVLKMVVVGFFDGEVCIFSLSTLQKGPAISIDADHLIVSDDGRTLGIGTKTGLIKIHDFETLTELYTVGFEDITIKSLHFSSNGLQILDARRKEFNVYQPATLHRRKDIEDTGSPGRTSFGTALSQQRGTSSAAAHIIINCFVYVSLQSGDYIICGKVDGSVCLYDASSGKFIQQLFAHATAEVILLDWNGERDSLISSDTANHILVHRVQLKQIRTATGTQPTWQVVRLYDRQVDTPIRQILSSVDGEYLLISDPESDHLWTWDGVDKLQHHCEHPTHDRISPQKWASHPRHINRLFEVDAHGVHALTWSRDSTAMPCVQTMATNSDERIDFETQDYGIHFVKFERNASGRSTWAAYDNDPFTPPVIWETSSTTSTDSRTEAALEHLNHVAPEVSNLIGIFRSQLYFLSQEGWLCSIPIENHNQNRLHTRHFPVPHCWRSLNIRLIAMITPKGDFVLVRGGEFAIVKRWLKLSLPSLQRNRSITR